jgi:salicyloyl-CoA 5-hydroxylase
VRIAILGGGPGGLYLAALLKAADPGHRVVVFERNGSDDTFGFGVVFSDTALRSLADGDPVVHERLADEGVHWQDIEIRLGGTRLRCGGHGFGAIPRHRLLRLLQDRCRELGVDLRHETSVDLEDVEPADLIVGADGAGSRVRERLAGTFRPQIVTGRVKFIWFGTTVSFDALTFLFERCAEGWFAVHGYPIAAGAATFIVETDDETWRRAGLDRFDVTQPPGPSDLRSREYVAEVFRDHLDGHDVLVNNSRWASFRTIRCARWRCGRVVLLGDAAHTAHFSVGSGTRMAMQDALALARAISAESTLGDALERYEAERRPQVDRIQDAARPSLSWWEHFGVYAANLEPTQFAYHFLTRSGRVDHRRLREDDPGFVAEVERWFAAGSGVGGRRHPLLVPLEGPVRSPGRVTALETPHPRAARIAAPAGRRELQEAFRRAASAVRAGAVLIAVAPAAGVPEVEARLGAILLAERVRFELAVPVLLEAPELDLSWATTMVLSGRANLVGVPAARLREAHAAMAAIEAEEVEDP